MIKKLFQKFLNNMTLSKKIDLTISLLCVPCVPLLGSCMEEEKGMFMISIPSVRVIAQPRHVSHM